MTSAFNFAHALLEQIALIGRSAGVASVFNTPPCDWFTTVKSVAAVGSGVGGGMVGAELMVGAADVGGGVGGGEGLAETGGGVGGGDGAPLDGGGVGPELDGGGVGGGLGADGGGEGVSEG